MFVWRRFQIIERQKRLATNCIQKLTITFSKLPWTQHAVSVDLVVVVVSIVNVEE